MKRAIIVDDEQLSIELIKYLITTYKLPIEVVGQALSGDEALELIYKLRPDLVFIDIEMPIMNGLEVIQRVKALKMNNISFIVVTAYAYFEYAKAALRLGAKDMLVKPIEPKIFLEAMQNLLEYKHYENKILNQILDYINENYYENIELKSCAAKFHVNSSYVARMFKKYCNTSLISYLNQYRIKMAENLIKETDMSIKEISLKVGYNNLNYFYKTFKKVTGVTPNDFKRNSN